MENWSVYYGRGYVWELEDTFETRKAAVKFAERLIDEGESVVKVEYTKTVTAMVLRPVEDK